MTVAELIEDYKVKLALSEDRIERHKASGKIDGEYVAIHEGAAIVFRKVINDLSKLEPDAEDNTNHPDEVQGHIRNLFD